jgi:hypothetical protein
VALNPGSNSFGLLSGLGDGRLSNPTLLTMSVPGLVVRAADFTGNGLTDLAILTPDGLFIYLADGHGGFLPPTQINVGFEPNGLTIADLNGDGKADLLVSNPLGDVLLLLSNGDGTFQPVHRLDQQVALAVDGSSGGAPSAFVFSDQLKDQVVVRSSNGATTVLGDASTGLVSPGAVKLADLNHDGILDLVVANSGSNNVLVYPGLGNGKFGQALNDGKGFFTGTDPVGITVADVNGDSRPDLIIADKGSNDVSILLNVKVGDSFTFVPGPRLQVGDGPVSTVVEDLSGNGQPDLLVLDSGSNDVRLLRGIGNGFFDDQHPTVYAVGTDPGWLFAGHFTAGSGPELVTVNSGSNSVTMISGLGTATPVTQTLPSGGIDPTAGFAVALPGTGLDSVVVANNGDGVISLFNPGDNGLSLASSLSSSAVPNPSAMALASFSGHDLEFYATNDGQESATLLGFEFAETVAGTSPGSLAGSQTGEIGGGGALSESAASSAPSATAQLLSLNESSLALVGSLLTVSLNTQNESEVSAEAAALGAVAAGPGTSAGQSLGKQTPAPEEGDETIETGEPMVPTPLSWAPYVMGLDRALETIRSEADQRLLQERASAEAGSNQSGGDDSARATETAAPMGQEMRGTSLGFQSREDRSEAIDLAIASLSWDDPDSSTVIGPAARGLTVGDSSQPSARFVEPSEHVQLPAASQDDPSGIVETRVSKVVTLVAIAATAAMGHLCAGPRGWRKSPAPGARADLGSLVGAIRSFRRRGLRAGASWLRARGEPQVK